MILLYLQKNKLKINLIREFDYNGPKHLTAWPKIPHETLSLKPNMYEQILFYWFYLLQVIFWNIYHASFTLKHTFE